MLYTVMPLERVYYDFMEKEKGKPKKDDRENTEYKEVVLSNGRVVTRREGDSYIVERINSTDMGDYLKEEYAPGKTIK